MPPESTKSSELPGSNSATYPRFLIIVMPSSHQMIIIGFVIAGENPVYGYTV